MDKKEQLKKCHDSLPDWDEINFTDIKPEPPQVEDIIFWDEVKAPDYDAPEERERRTRFDLIKHDLNRRCYAFKR